MTKESKHFGQVQFYLSSATSSFCKNTYMCGQFKIHTVFVSFHCPSDEKTARSGQSIVSWEQWYFSFWVSCHSDI